MTADSAADASPPSGPARRQRLRLLVSGPDAAFAFIQGAVKVAGNPWTVDRLHEETPGEPENVGAFLIPCEAATNPLLTSLANRIDAPIILYTTGQKRFANGRASSSESVVSLTSLSPHEIVSTIRRGIERWRHSRVLQNSSQETRESTSDAQEKTEFLAAVNHEVRTPLNAILGMAEMLIESALTPEQDRFAHVIRSSGSDLLRVLDQLVDLTRLRGTTLRFPRSEFDLAELVQSAAESETVAIGKRSLGISIDIDPILPRTVIGSADRLHQVLSTLIACSVRQTSCGEIRIRVSPHLDTGDSAIVRFAVEHTGEGMGSEQLDEILRSFATSAPPISRDHGGIGIGLALAAGLVRAMGGEIWAESDERALCFALPLQAMRLRRDEMQISDSLQGIRVCIASPQPGEALVLRRALEEAGAFVEVIPSAESIPEVIQAGIRSGLAVDIVFLDESNLAMVDLAAMGDSMTGPQVITMAFAEKTNFPSPLPPGVAKRISKPLRLEQVIHTVESLARGAGSANAPAAQQRSMRILIADDSEDNLRLIATFLAKTPNELRFAANGQEALEAFQSEPFDLVLMDIQMPKMNGYDATLKIREHESTYGLSPTPIAALTAFAFDEDAERSLEAGCDEHLTKPIDKKTLLDLIAKFSRRSTKTVS